MVMSKYPESEKLKTKEFKLIREFLSFLRNVDCEIVKSSGGLAIPDDSIIYAFFDVNERELEKEKRRMLDEIQTKEG